MICSRLINDLLGNTEAHLDAVRIHVAVGNSDLAYKQLDAAIAQLEEVRREVFNADRRSGEGVK